MPQRVIAALVALGLLLGLLRASQWVPNVALVVLAGVVVWQYASRARGRNASR